MSDLPADLLHGEWPCKHEIELLRRTQAAHHKLTARVQAMTRELRGERYYPLQTETKQLRVRVYHTYVPPVEASEDTPAAPGRWTLRIEGLDATADEPTIVKFSSYFRKASIELDPHLYSDHVIEWTSFQKTSHDVDGLEVSRTGSTAHTVKIKLLPAQTPERFTISPELDATIGQYLGPAKAYTKQDIVLAMWQYIKLRNLIKVDDCRVVSCDDRMIQVLNCVSLPFTSIIVALKQHLTPVNVIDLEYTLSLSTECEFELLDEHFFDVSVAATSDLDKTRARALKECDELQQDQKKEMELLQAQEADILEQLQAYTRKKEWMTQFAQDPCRFMADVKKSQLADEQILGAETELDEFTIPQPHQFTQPWVRESPLNRLFLRGETSITDDGAISIARHVYSLKLRVHLCVAELESSGGETHTGSSIVLSALLLHLVPPGPSNYCIALPTRLVHAPRQSFMQQPSTRLRCDPTDYAKRQQEKKERAKELREQRQRGVFSDDHTFTPKVNPRARQPASSREELDPASKALASDSMAYRNNGHNNNNFDGEDQHNYENDALDSLSRRYPTKAPPTPQQQMAPLHVTPLEPEHDTLFREVKRTTGRELEDLPIKKTVAAPRAANHTGPCLRNSSCGCPKCAGGGLAPSSTSNALEAPIRRREPRAAPPTDPYRESGSRTTASSNEMGNALMLLKSKMSRRKARSAPTNQASLFVEKNTPSAVVHSARLPSSTNMARDTPTPPPRQTVASRRAPSQAPAPPARRKTPLQNVDENSAGDTRYPPPITTGFNLSEELDEYADGAEEMEQCHNCNRKFNVISFQKHQKICEKVFSGQRKVFNMAAKRLEGTEAEKIAREAKAKTSGGGARKAQLSATEQPIKAKNAVDWKQKSNMFRDAMKASRDVTKALKEGKELPPMMPSAPDPSLIQCEYCSRRFNDKAAERHINFCREKSQRDSFKAPAKRVTAAKPGSRAAATRKR